jgi:hypothetical protein
MTHYRLADSMPSAIILARNPRTSSLDELKTYQGNDIFLNNGDEFQIRLFNPLSEKIGAQVSINGKTSQNLLVLNPGEDVVVDRFLDEQRKMLFETYKYDEGNQAAVNAVANNGRIELRFFKEYVTYDYATLYNVNGMGNAVYGNSGPTGSMGSSGISGTGGFTGQGSFTTTTNNVFLSSTNLTIGMYKSPGIYTSESDLSFVSDSQPEVKSTKRFKKSLKETGRVEKGGQSDQGFKAVDIKFQSYAFHTILYNLKPMSEKNSYAKEVRDYCTECGYRLRNNSWIFCPKCGEKI